MLANSMLACGPYIKLADEGLELTAIVFLVIKPLAYYAYIRAFRYRVSRHVPMSIAQAVKLTVCRGLLGLVLVGGGTALILLTGAAGTMPLIHVSWAYMYAARLFAWWYVGSQLAGIRGRRLVGWVIGGALLNAGLDAAAVIGLFAGRPPVFIVIGVVFVFILLLHLIGRRASLKARFSEAPLCNNCLYNLTGNLSGICPECGTPVGGKLAAQR